MVLAWEFQIGDIQCRGQVGPFGVSPEMEKEKLPFDIIWNHGRSHRRTLHLAILHQAASEMEHSNLLYPYSFATFGMCPCNMCIRARWLKKFPLPKGATCNTIFALIGWGQFKYPIHD